MKTLIVLSLALVGLNVHAAGADGSAYKGKVMLIQNKKHVSKCFPVGPKTLDMLTTDYDTCGSLKSDNAALAKSHAKCDKADGSIAYIFENNEDCTASQSDLGEIK